MRTDDELGCVESRSAGETRNARGVHRIARGRHVRNRDWRPTLRTFGIGAACGFVVGAAFVAVLITRYGQVAGIDPGSQTVMSDDGLADVDSPVIEAKKPASPSPVATTGSSTPVVKAAPPE